MLRNEKNKSMASSYSQQKLVTPIEWQVMQKQVHSFGPEICIAVSYFIQ